MSVTETRRIVLLGKTGAGKSNLVNTILEEDVFTINNPLNSGTKECEADTTSMDHRGITLVDTPGFFDTDISEKKMKPEIVKCIIECAPGPHAFLIVLKYEKITKQEKAIFEKISQYFSEEAYKYATVVFTHGDQLPEGKKIEDFVSQNKCLSDLVENCSGRCHVIDNKYWKNKQQDEYRSNQFQVAEILNTIDKIVMENNGGCYTIEMLQTVEKETQQEEKQIRLLPGNMSEKEIREKAKLNFFKKFLIRVAGTATGMLFGALFGVVVMVGIVDTVLKESSKPVSLKQAIVKTTFAGGGIITAAVGGATLCTISGTFASAGAVKGGLTGFAAAEGAGTPQEAAKRVLEANEAQSYLDKANDVWGGLTQPEKSQNQ